MNMETVRDQVFGESRRDVEQKFRFLGVFLEKKRVDSFICLTNTLQFITLD